MAIAPLNIPTELRYIKAFVRQAKELDEDQISPQSRVVAYHCRMYAAQEGIKCTTSSEGEKYLGDLIDRMSSERENISTKRSTDLHVLCRDFANNIFDRADTEDKAGTSGRSTADQFASAAVYYEMIQQFYNIKMDEGQEKEDKNWAYCLRRAAEILRAVEENSESKSIFTRKKGSENGSCGEKEELKCPPELKNINVFVHHAEKLDRNDRAEAPVLAYYCRVYAVQQGMLCATSEERDSFLCRLFDQIELEKEAMTNITPKESHLLCRGFADQMFENAIMKDEAGNASKETAESFLTASIFYEILQQFHDNDEEETKKSREQKEEEKKKVHSLRRAVEVFKEIEGGKGLDGSSASKEDIDKQTGKVESKDTKNVIVIPKVGLMESPPSVNIINKQKGVSSDNDDEINDTNAGVGVGVGAVEENSSGKDNFAASTSPPLGACVVATLVEDSLDKGDLCHSVFPQNNRRRDVEPYALNEEQINVLEKQGFTRGLARSLEANCEKFPICFWVIDNSFSMEAHDGHRIIDTANHTDVRTSLCTRWEEIKDCVSYHARMSQLLGSKTHFRLLNDPKVVPQKFTIDNNGSTYNQLLSNLSKTVPMGLTPTADHIQELENIIRPIAPSMESMGQRAVIVLATDGLPISGKHSSTEEDMQEFVRAMRSLEGLPIWVVIRLCTDEQDVVDFYGNLDGQLNLSLDVLDDFEGEAEEVYEHNKWLTYGLPIHKMRELGFHDHVFDLIDKQPLTKEELKHFLFLLFGEEKSVSIPDPSADWCGFVKEVEKLLVGGKCQWNPVKKEVMPWIDIKELKKNTEKKLV